MRQITHCVSVYYLHGRRTQQTWLFPRRTLGYNCEHPAIKHGQ